MPDRLDATRDALRKASKDHDLILTSGGVSVGEEDHIKPAVTAEGRLDLWQIAIKPGKPLAFGAVRKSENPKDGEAWFIGLPGKLATAQELGIGGRRRWWRRHLCPEGCLSEAFLALSAVASTLEGQQQNPKGKPNRACERDKRSCCDFDKQVFVR